MKELAIKIIEHAFRDKVDRAGEPYTKHLYRVAEKCDYETLKIVALLHDLLEDCTEWNEKSLRTFFTDQIVDAVVALTMKKGQHYDDYISQVLENAMATRVKRYDLEDNMDITRLQKLTDKDILRLKKYHEAYLRIIA